VVDKCYVEASKDIMFSIFCQSMAKHFGMDALDKRKKLVRGWSIDLNKANKLILPAVNRERGVTRREAAIEEDKAAGGEKEDECSNGNTLMMGG
jgi:hypothetical protein